MGAPSCQEPAGAGERSMWGRGAPRGDGGPCTDSKDTLGTVGSGLVSHLGHQAGLQEGVPGTPSGTRAPPAAWNLLLDAACASLCPSWEACWCLGTQPRGPRTLKPCSPRPCGPHSAALSWAWPGGQGLSERTPAMMVFPQTGHGVAELDIAGHVCTHARAHGRVPCRSHRRVDAPTHPNRAQAPGAH